MHAVAVGVALALGGCALPSLPELEIPGNDASFSTRVYAGASMGNSHLTPDTRAASGFSVGNSDDLGTQLRLGVDVHNMLAVELDTSVLGAAKLREQGADVKYSAAAVSALVYGLNGVQLRSRREGWSAYGRFGIGVLKKSSRVVSLNEGGTGPIIGAGMEYGMPSGLGVRGEITRFDGDAVHLGLGAIYRFGVTPREVGGLIAEVAAPVLASTDRRVPEGGRALAHRTRFGQADFDTDPPVEAPRNWATGTFSRWRPPALADDRDGDGVRDVNDRCPDSGGDMTVDRVGCGLFDGVLADVVFKSGSKWLTPRARGELDTLAERLLAFPEARVRVLAHTDSSGSARDNLALSVQRADVVSRYLRDRGVAELQLEREGLGETRPLASNGNADGRRRNRRVEIETLSNLDPVQVALASSADDRREPARRSRPEPAATPIAKRAVKPTPAPAPTSAPTPAPTPVREPDPVPVRVDEPARAAASVPEPDVDTPSDAGEPWRARYEPAVGAARPAARAAKAVAAMTASRPAPLPRPGFVSGLAVSGVIRDVGFVSGSIELLPEADPELARIAAELGRYPEARVAIMAHTDDRGSEADNMALSLERAATVLERFVELGVDRSRLEAEGYGESLPRVQNVTADDRARNRRVELRVLR